MTTNGDSQGWRLFVRMTMPLILAGVVWMTTQLNRMNDKMDKLSDRVSDNTAAIQYLNGRFMDYAESQ